MSQESRNDRWRQIEEIFELALERAEEEREAFVRGSRAGVSVIDEVLALLRADAARGDTLHRAVQRQTSEFTAGESRYGPWRVVREIGAGGMGMVYAVERDDGAYKQTAALKLIKREADSKESRERFVAERQILAELRHPNIAALLDGGSSDDGRPYLVMEYIEGEAITAHASARALTVRQRVALFVDVCRAVHAAHQKFIAHRDLKPSNIFVTASGAVKLLDFGIAKLIDPDFASGRTETVARALTPDYASPEQVTGDAITTATDIYSLGAVLFELLTMEKPHQLSSYSMPEIVERVVKSGIGLPSEIAPPEWRRVLRGDLDNIVQMAMRKEPERRYGSAADLALDLDNYLTGLPVTARTDTFGYRAGKFVRRNKWGVAAAALTAASLLGATAVSVYQARRAERRFAQVRQLANTLLFDGYERIRPIPGALSMRVFVAKTANQYLESLREDAKEDPSLAGEVAVSYERLGDIVSSSLGSSLEREIDAATAYRRSIELGLRALERTPESKALHAAVSRSASKLSGVESRAKRYDEADRLNAIAEREADLSGDFEARNRAMIALYERYMFADRNEEAVASVRVRLESLRLERARAETPYVRIQEARSLYQLARTLKRLKLFEEAARRAEESLAAFESLLRTDPQNEIIWQHLGILYDYQAEELIRLRGLGKANDADILARAEKSVELAHTLLKADQDNAYALQQAAYLERRLARVKLPADARKAAAILLAAAGKYEKVKRISPGRAGTEFALAQTLGELSLAQFDLGDKAAARTTFQAAMNEFDRVKDQTPSALETQRSRLIAEWKKRVR